MALLKAIRQEDGVTTSYHRVLYLQSATNSHVSIAVISYVDEASRKADVAGESRPYRRTKTYETGYEDGMTAEKAYEWLKANAPEFEGAKHV